ncbi:MAG: mandelate racemase/muconate lactonizing enzyme family protein, partial [Pseudomonadota bacterium]
DDGMQGWGQTAPYHADITAQILHRQIAPHALGKDCHRINHLVGRIAQKEHKFPGSYIQRAIGGLDTALWDMLAKRAERPVCELLGGSPGPVRTYGSSMRRDLAPQKEAERLLRLRDAHGFDAFKFRIGAECGRNKDEWPGFTQANVESVSKAFNGSVDLLVDANSCFTPKRAIEIGTMLQDHGISHFEEPCLYWHYEQTKQVTDALEIDVTGGEQDCELANWRRMIADHIVNIIQPDICYIGGICNTLTVSELAQVAGLRVTPHCANLSMVTLFTMHLLRAIPNAGKYLEFSIEDATYYPWQYDIFTADPFVITDGKAIVSDAPGWGVEIAPNWLENAQYQMSQSDQGLGTKTNRL